MLHYNLSLELPGEMTVSCSWKFFTTALWLNKRKLKKIPRRRRQRKCHFLARTKIEAYL